MHELVGQVIDGAYRVDAFVGQGAMAHVYRVTEVATGLTRAMKVMAPQSRGDTDLQRRFQREFQACARVDHRNVVHLFKFGTLADGAFYYTMDFLPHPSLEDVLAKEKRLSETRALSLLMQAADGLAVIHPLGVIHRDLKPANMILAEQDRLVIVDFGLARDESRTQLTATGTMLGTPYYMAPEMIQGDKVGPAADLYALGVIAYELVAGRKPFLAPDVTALFTAIMYQQPEPLSTVVPGLSPRWDDLTGRCLAKAPADRYPTAAALGADLKALRDELLGARAAAAPPLPAHLFTATGEQPPPAATASGVGALRASRAPRAALAGTQPPRARPSKALAAAAPSGAHAAVSPPSPASSSGVAGPARLKAPVAAFALAALGLAGWFVLRPAGPSPYRVLDLRVQPDAGALVVRWSSDVPYPSRVQLDGRAAKVYEGQEGQPVTTHEVAVGPLDENATYAVRVLLPDGGSSLPKSATTASLKAEGLAVVERPDGVHVTWRCRAAATASLLVGARGASTTAPGRRLGDESWTAVLRTLPPDADALALELVVAGGSPRRVDLAPLVRADLLAAMRPVASCDFTRLMNDITKQSSAAMEPEFARLKRERGLAPDAELEVKDLQRIRHQAEGKLFTAAMERHGIREAYDRLVSLSRLVFGTALVPPEVRDEVYQVLVTALKLERYSLATDLEPPFLLEGRPWLGDRARTLAPSPRPDATVPCRLPAKCVFSAPRVQVLWAPPTRIRGTFELDRVDDLARAEVVLVLDNPKEIGIRLRVNDRVDVWLLEDRPRTAETDIVTNVLRVPLRALKQGTNVLELNAELYFNDTSNDSFELRSMAVALWRNGNAAAAPR